MKNNILLSICIPTYNRPHYLKNCLESIIRQFEDKNTAEQVEVVIFDSSLKEDTENLVKKYQKHFNNIKYIEDKEDVGFDQSVLNSVLEARGKYCWFLGDDDVIKNGCLKTINYFLEKNEIALLTVAFHPSYEIKIASQKIKEEPKEFTQKYIACTDSHEGFYLKGYCEGTFGIFIINKDLWLKMEKTNYEKMWMYYGMILRMIAISGLRLAHINYPIVYAGQDYEWKKGGFELFASIGYKRILETLTKSGWSKKFVNNELKIPIRALPFTLLKAKSNDLKCSFSNLIIICKEFYKHPLSLAPAIIIFFIPNSFIKILKKYKKKANSHVHRLF